uniref:Leucine-rich repeat-containing protein 51 n=1 Tax=Panagrellus redivivus TaxID=6233 RepID=A0A7E5A142_PANRE
MSVASTNQSTSTSGVPVWVYVIFRKNPSSGHDKMTINISADGPVFWNRHVIYAFCCSCHFEKHEDELLQLMARFDTRVERVCLVDKPVDYSFLPDSFFRFLATALPSLQFVYLRELNLERLNRATVEQLAVHPKLKKLIVHGCRNYEALQDFRNLPQLLVVKGEIVGLKAMIGDIGDSPEDSPTGLGRLEETRSEASVSTSSVSVSDSESGPTPAPGIAVAVDRF